MGTLVILIAAILGGLACAKQTLYQSWIFLVNLVFSVYLAVFLSPLIRDLLLPSLKPGRETEAYLLPSIMLALFLVLIIALYKVTDAVITIDFDDYPIPAPVNKVGAMAFAALSGAVLAAFLLSCFAQMPLAQSVPADRVSLADSGRKTLTAVVHAVNGFSLQGTSKDAAAVLENLTAYQPPSGGIPVYKTEKKDEASLPEVIAEKIVKKKRSEKIDGKAVEPSGSAQAGVSVPRGKQVEKIDGKAVELSGSAPAGVSVPRGKQVEKIDGKAVEPAGSAPAGVSIPRGKQVEKIDGKAVETP